MTEEKWDLEAALAELRATDHGRSRKLTFRQQCEIFVLMYGGSRNGMVARAYGVTRATVSNIAGCLEDDPTPVRTRLKLEGGEVSEESYVSDHNRGRNPNRYRHYEDVAREFEALGEQGFNERYLTKAVFDRLRAARAAAPPLGRPKINPPTPDYRYRDPDDDPPKQKQYDPNDPKHYDPDDPPKK